MQFVNSFIEKKRAAQFSYSTAMKQPQVYAVETLNNMG